MKNLKYKLQIAFILMLWLFSCNGGFSQSFFSTVSGSCASDNAVELGTKFTTSANATITGLRFYKCTSTNETYSLKLYSGSTLLLSTSYSGSALGWVIANIPATSIIPGINYTVSYYAANSRYQFTSSYAWPVRNGTLTATGSSYKYGGGFPNLTYQTSNYFADVVVQGSLPPSTGDTVYIRDTIVIKDTVVLPCYPPDSSLIVTNGNTIEKYYWFFKDKPVHDTVDLIILDTVYLKDTLYYTIWDTLYLPQVCPSDTIIYLHDTIYMQCRDTTHVLIGWDGYDTMNYDLPHYDRFKVVELTTFDGKKIRYVHYIKEVIKHEEYDETTGTWIEK